MKIPSNVMLRKIVLKTIGSTYIYNSDFDEITKIGSLNITTSQINESINSFQNMSVLQRKCAPSTDEMLVKEILNRQISQLTLQVTQGCNLRCSYCPYSQENTFTRSHNNSLNMTVETARESILFYAQHSRDCNNKNIAFYGGEPIFNFKLIKEAVEFGNKMFGENVSYHMTTNATLLTRNILEFLDTNDFRLMISIDGPENINDRNRKFSNGHLGVFKRVIDKIELIKKDYPCLYRYLSINMVLTPDNTFTEYQDFIQSNMYIFKDIGVNASIVSEIGLDISYSQSEIFIEEYKYFQFLVLIDIFTEIEFPHQYLVLMKNYKNDLLTFLRKFQLYSGIPHKGKINTTGQCIPLKTRMFVSVDGDLHPCEKVMENHSTELGSVYTDIDHNKVNQLYRFNSSFYEKCENCFALNYCSNCIALCSDKDLCNYDGYGESCGYIKNNLVNNLATVCIIRELSTRGLL
ncbi:radical SAM protein [Erysipelothrix rhusiopathiae]|uniref:CLI_3235-class bacteriocin maturation radical SAM enzyme n=1 Tax=Erysipelothrix rhusiopathiae ATCC 19414 TaxID=525280 RepID=E7FTU8_ERYRH|nr:radical SAM protein [Erysipelothrix rhusiopathiae]EFY09437.1 CLI_3235-class bacteriocin maturation radical SAM enzyme [Erysipelothrix rhusiopathiae ATCC 19414]MDE8257383.1 radical SAM protein [Erysipelothrix rhusiopathiae]MDV7679265.1 radical SAM protein [Erysipelothrix rhusiopathiae]URQ77922.1 radical SAM protein [Erysipelothrix rhusiopathiae]VEH84257.1 Anaerobic sulfatase-maturating enzyme [Erysipelothrix rhusiopathiae]